MAGLDRGQAHIMAGNCQRLNHRAVFQRQVVRQSIDGVGRDSPVSLKGAGRINAEELEMMADMLMTSRAGRAGAAGCQRHDRHPFASLEMLDSFAQLMYRPRHLVTKRLRHSDPLVHRAVEDVQVSAADAAVRDF